MRRRRFALFYPDPRGVYPLQKTTFASNPPIAGYGRSGGARILEQAGPAAGPKVIW